MGKHYSEYFDIPHELFEKKGVYDGFINKDSRLHIDPILLKGCTEPEFIGAYDSYIHYFDNIIAAVPFVQERSLKDRFYHSIYNYLQFKELPNTGLGYSKTGSGGTGIGGKISCQLTNAAIDIINAGAKDPAIFAIVHFFEEGIGADRISDMIISILYDSFLKYTSRIATEMGIQCITYRFNDQSYDVPCLNGGVVIFIPCVLLCKLPIVSSYHDVDDVCEYNKRLRRKICEKIGMSWKDVMSMRKSEIKRELLSHASLIDDILLDYKELSASPYDFYNDRYGEYMDIRVRDFLAPIQFQSMRAVHTPDDVYSLALQICEDFKYAVEDRGMWKLLYNKDTKTFRDEESIQLIFFLVAEFRCMANNIDLNRENNSGVGEIDIKLSSGTRAKVIIEIKRLSSSVLIHGYTEQLPDYMRAEKTSYGIYIVVDDMHHKTLLRKKQKLSQAQRQTGLAMPIIYVDASIKTSASKRK